ncbi:MBL fold metallo-hydrolase [Anoxynatronum buryatiense]|uniref:Glyoxylase, beta-lactamase superfamily II n=1 Tax=Anoxynatronum buryatiense TaxID=489973 RepID=A0AA45WWD5_9CLOT|nr:MBL fold metallo-hydrolase [Anoxynatronum buryatiense]SMP59014.1 Glyoxylase, beta-lactamase superfamily II [Anoxynatronum buryatiense]
MLQQVYPHIYKNEIQLPGNPLKAVHSYLITSPERNLLIDTGFNRPDCLETLLQGMTEAGAELEKTDLFITHLHSDHSGLASALSQRGVKVYASQWDGDAVNEMSQVSYWQRFEGFRVLFDLEQDQVTFQDHPGYKYRSPQPVSFQTLQEGDTLTLGDYVFEVIEIPGHTPGQLGLYERTHRLFFCGDHILDRITPNIAFWDFQWDILDVYLNNLQKVAAFDINHLFSAHRGTVADHRQRIQELTHHHQLRLTEIMGILKEGHTTVREVAARMHWELRYNSWDDFPHAQKWFAAGEAMSHLEHLAATGQITKEERQGVLHYQIL